MLLLILVVGEAVVLMVAIAERFVFRSAAAAETEHFASLDLAPLGIQQHTDIRHLIRTVALDLNDGVFRIGFIVHKVLSVK
jgi:hypothetical protein